MLACGSLGLIGLSRFLHCFVSLFPTLSAVFAVFVPYICYVPTLHFIHSYRKGIVYPKSQACVFRSLNRSASYAFSLSTSTPLPNTQSYTSRQKSAPALPLRGRRSAHFVLSLSATLTPLADGSRLSTTQAKNYFAIAPPVFTASFRLRAVLSVRLIPLRPHTAPDHPPLKFS